MQDLKQRTSWLAVLVALVLMVVACDMDSGSGGDPVDQAAAEERIAELVDRGGIAWEERLVARKANVAPPSKQRGDVEHEKADAYKSAKSNPFGDAKPRDELAIQQQKEEERKRREEAAAAKRAAERKEREAAAAAKAAANARTTPEGSRRPPPAMLASPSLPRARCNSSRTSPASRWRCALSRASMRESRSRTRAGVCCGRRSRSTSLCRMAPMVSVVVSPTKGERPVRHS